MLCMKAHHVHVLFECSGIRGRTSHQGLETSFLVQTWKRAWGENQVNPGINLMQINIVY